MIYYAQSFNSFIKSVSEKKGVSYENKMYLYCQNKVIHEKPMAKIRDIINRR